MDVCVPAMCVRVRLRARIVRRLFLREEFHTCKHSERSYSESELTALPGRLRSNQAAQIGGKNYFENECAGIHVLCGCMCV